MIIIETFEPAETAMGVCPRQPRKRRGVVMRRQIVQDNPDPQRSSFDHLVRTAKQAIWRAVIEDGAQ